MPALAGLGPAWMYARADLRRRWKSAVAIAILIGIAGAVVLTAYAGARRTDSAYPRYLKATHAADFLVATEKLGTVAHEPVLQSCSISARSPAQRHRPGAVARLCLTRG